MVSDDGIKPDQSLISSIATCPLLEIIFQLRSFLKLAYYYRRFIKNFEKIASPMTAMLETNKAFIKTYEGKRALTKIKHFFTNPPILAYPNFSVTFILDTNASDLGIGAVLSQKGQDELEHSIAYYSRQFNKHYKHYSVTRKELLVAIESMDILSAILMEKNLSFVLTMPQFNGKIF